ncbi:hypothetical protein PM082_010630 [Marasmius tenuissimus]|nr:hypothetical protein PM082_010630 [Marasmius tenuissimus]
MGCSDSEQSRMPMVDLRFPSQLQHKTHRDRFSAVAVASVFIYDYFLTLPDEVKHIWPSEWSTTKILYILQRYMPFIDTVILVLYNDFTPGLSDRFCRISYAISGCMFVIGIGITEVLLTLRLWAVWQKNRRLTFALPILFVSCWATILAMMGVFLSSMTFGPPILPHLGCHVTGGSPILFVCWVLVMLYNGATMALMIVSAVSLYGSRRSPDPASTGINGLVYVVHRDGVVYYVILFSLALANVITIVILPSELLSILSSFERVMHSMLTSRVIHNIKGYSVSHLRSRSGRSRHESQYELSQVSLPTIIS